MKSKLLKLQESIGDNEQLIDKFVEAFAGVPDSEENSPETEIMVEQFCTDNQIELKEDYDISSLNLKKGTVLELADLEDALNLTKGKNRKELSLFYNDGGVISVKVLKDGQNTVNGVVVSVEAHSGSSELANKNGVLSLIKNGLENGDLSYLLEEETENPDCLPLDKMPLAEMVSELSPENYELVESHFPTGSKRRLTEAVNTILSESDEEIPAETSAVLEALVSPFFSIDTPDGMERTTDVTNDKVAKLVESRKMTASPTRKGLFILKESNGDLAGVYNANTEELDTVIESEFDKAVDEVLTESAEKVRVPKDESKKFNDALKTAGMDFSHSSTPNTSFDDFYLNDIKRDEAKKFVKDYMQNGGRAVLVERMKESDDAVQTKEYADVILENADGQVLLLKRTNEDDLEPSKLGFAGGKLEEGETPEDAAIRELKEETGVEVDSVSKAGEYQNPDGSTSHYFKATLPEGQEVRISEEHQDLKWVEPSKMLEEEGIIFESNDRYDELCNQKLEEGELSKTFRTLTPDTDRWADNEIKNGKPQGVLNRVSDRVAIELGYLSQDGKKVLDQKGYSKVIGEVFRIGFGKNKHLKESDQAELGGTVEDKDGNSWKVEDIDENGFKLSSEENGEKHVAFDEIDSLLKETVALTESRKIISIRRLKESVSEADAIEMVESEDLDKIMEESDEVAQNSVDVDSLIPLGEATDEFGDTIEVAKDEDGGLFAMEVETPKDGNEE